MISFHWWSAHVLVRALEKSSRFICNPSEFHLAQKFTPFYSLMLCFGFAQSRGLQSVVSNNYGEETELSRLACSFDLPFLISAGLWHRSSGDKNRMVPRPDSDLWQSVKICREANGIIVPPMCVSGTNMGMHGIWACWVESQPSEKSEEKTSSLDQLQGLPATKNHSQLAASWLFRMPLAERIPILLAEFS